MLLAAASALSIAQADPDRWGGALGKRPGREILGQDRWEDPPGFRWGVATSAYQIEGAVAADGRLESIWDVSARGTRPDGQSYTHNGDSGEIADGSYDRFFEDIALMKNMGVKHYRFSIAWPRILPTGRLPVNQPGIDHYSALIDALLAADITPAVTLYHWDLPQALNEDDLPGGPGWLNEATADAFREYAETCFEAFGDRVKTWITFNEALTFVHLGYGTGSHAPNRCSNRDKCFAGDSATEQYVAAHNVLLAHGAAVESFRTGGYDGEIGITINANWATPLHPGDPDDIVAAERSMVWQAAWWADPVYFGDYPSEMRAVLGDRLPTFTSEQSERLRGSADFWGANHYTSKYTRSMPTAGLARATPGWDADMAVQSAKNGPNGTPIGPSAASGWLSVVPWGIRENLKWISKRYNNPKIYITENGCDVPGESDLPLEDAIHDDFRVDFYTQYTTNVLAAYHIDGVNVQGYYAWSLMDNFEWSDGYNMRFGMVYVDGVGEGDGGVRHPKDSARWLTARMAAGGQTIPDEYLSCGDAAAAVAAAPIGATYKGPELRRTERPNILMILSDDFGWADAGWHRGPCEKDVVTPFMEQLVAQGVEFDRHYAFKYCSPTRVSLQVTPSSGALLRPYLSEKFVAVVSL